MTQSYFFSLYQLVSLPLIQIHESYITFHLLLIFMCQQPIIPSLTSPFITHFP